MRARRPRSVRGLVCVCAAVVPSMRARHQRSPRPRVCSHRRADRTVQERRPSCGLDGPRQTPRRRPDLHRHGCGGAGDRRSFAADSVNSELRPLGVAGMGPRDRAHQPPDHRRAHLEAAPGGVHDGVLAVRQGRAGPLAGRRPGRRGDCGRDGVQGVRAPRTAACGAPRRGRGPHRVRRVRAARAGGIDRDVRVDFRGRVHHRQRARLLRGVDDRVGPDRGRSPPRRQVPPGIRRRLCGRAGPSRDLAVLGALRPVAVLEGSRSPQARRRPVRVDPGVVVPAGVLGVGPLLPRRHACSYPPLQQRGVRQMPVLHRVRQACMAHRPGQDQDRCDHRRPGCRHRVAESEPIRGAGRRS